MDQQEIDIRKDIDQTRASMDRKIDMIVDRIHDTIVGPKLAADALLENLDEARKAMQETTLVAVNDPNRSHAAVTGAVDRVQAIFHLLEQTKREPWIILSGALLMGYVIGCMNGGNVFTIRHTNSKVKDPELRTTTSPACFS